MRWTLRRKIFSGYGIALTLVVVVFVWAIINLRALGQASDAILRENYRSILAAENMIDALERQDSATLLLLLGNDATGLAQFRENESQFLQWLGRAKDNITIKGEAEIVATIDTAYASYLTDFSRLHTFVQTNPESAARFYYDRMFRAFTEVRQTCIRLREINQETMFDASDRARNLAVKAIWSMTAIGVTAIAIGLGFSLVLSILLVRPIRQIMAAAQKIAVGDYSIEVATTSSDELGHLAGEFNVMANKLKSYHDLNVEQIIAEKLKSEAIIRSIDDGIVVVDAEFKVTGINPTAAKVFAIEPEQALSRHFLEVVKSEPLFKYLRESAATEKPPAIADGDNIITVKRNDLLQHYMFSITPMRAKPEGLLGVVLLLRDVTRLKELDRLKSEFVMTASHELRTPLASVGMSIDLLLENAMPRLSDNDQQLLTAAHEEIHRLKTLVSDLLDLSRIEAGKIELEFDQIPVVMLFEKAVAVLQNQTEEKSIELTFALPKGLPSIKADVNKITWVLTNLIANALRYTDRGGHIRLAAAPRGRWVEVSVHDDGAGIPFEYQSRIFDKFTQVKSDKTVGGSGLGLAICREIVRAHSGVIWVESVPGKGSTFTFTLPVAE